jgi:hypothetical protein
VQRDRWQRTDLGGVRGVDRGPETTTPFATACSRVTTTGVTTVKHFALIVVTLMVATSSALADDQVVDASPAAPTPQPPKIGLPAGLLYTDSHVTTADTGNFIALGWFPTNDFTLYAGFGLTYDPNGSVKDALGLSGTMNNKLASDLVLGAGYFVIDNVKANIFMGPEVVWIANVAPESFADVSVVEVAWAIRYGLWRMPVAIGTDLGVTFTGVYGAKGPTIATAPFGLHVVYAFN